MSLWIWAIALSALIIFLFVLVLALCKAAADSDKAMERCYGGCIDDLDEAVKKAGLK